MSGVVPVETVAAVLDHALAQPPRWATGGWCCVDGPAGSGKSTLARAVAEAGQSRVASVHLIHTDDLLDGWRGLPRSGQAAARRGRRAPGGRQAGAATAATTGSQARSPRSTSWPRWTCWFSTASAPAIRSLAPHRAALVWVERRRRPPAGPRAGARRRGDAARVGAVHARRGGVLRRARRPRARGPETRRGRTASSLGWGPCFLPPASSSRSAAASYRAVVTECGASLRLLEHAGRALLDGFGEDATAVGRPRPAADAVAEPDRRRRVLLRGPRPPARADRAGPRQRVARAGPLGGVELEEHTAALGLPGVPADGADRLPVDARPARALRPVRRRADRDPDRHEPVGVRGAVRAGRPSLPARGSGPVDRWSCRCRPRPGCWCDDRLLPTGREQVEGTAYDFRVSRPIRATRAGRRVHRPRPATPTAWRPSSCATRSPAAASPSGSTSGTAGCRSSAPTRRPRHARAGPWPSSR